MVQISLWLEWVITLDLLVWNIYSHAFYAWLTQPCIWLVGGKSRPVLVQSEYFFYFFFGTLALYNHLGGRGIFFFYGNGSPIWSKQEVPHGGGFFFFFFLWREGMASDWHLLPMLHLLIGPNMVSCLVQTWDANRSFYLLEEMGCRLIWHPLPHVAPPWSEQGFRTKQGICFQSFAMFLALSISNTYFAIVA